VTVEEQVSPDGTRVLWQCRVCGGEAWGPALPANLPSTKSYVVVYPPECWGDPDAAPHGPVRMRRQDK
jgi:hypothetical protein